MNAESAYLFRHALLRDAAYQLHLPGERARLHALTLVAIEGLFGGRAPAPPPLDAKAACRLEPHPTDPFADELARHARESIAAEGSPALLKLYLKRAASWAEANFRVESAGRQWREYAECAEGAERGAAALLAARALGRHGATALSDRMFSMALETFHATGDRRGEGVARQIFAERLVELGRLEEARGMAEQARTILREAGDAAESTALATLANVEFQSGRTGPAEKLYSEALSEYRKSGNLEGESVGLANLGSLFSDTGRVAEAEGHFRQALALQRATGDRRREGMTIGSLAGLYQVTGRFLEAEQAFGEALAIQREIGTRPLEGLTLGGLASLMRVTGRAALADTLYGQALAIHREVGNRRLEGVELGRLANLRLDSGRREEAEPLYRQALAIHRDLSNRRAEGVTLGNLAVLFLESGRLEEAGRAGEAALAIHRQSGNRRSEARLLANLAKLYLDTNRPESAGKAIATALSIQLELHDTFGEAVTRCLSAPFYFVQARPDLALDEWRQGVALLRGLGDSAEIDRQVDSMRRLCGMAGVEGFDDERTRTKPPA